MIKKPGIHATAFLACFFFMLVCAMPAKSQVHFFYNDSSINVPGSQVTYYVDSSAERSLQRYGEIQQQLLPMMRNNINLSYQNEMLWLRIAAGALPGLNDLRYLMLRNPHINYLGIWILDSEAVVKSYPLTGDHLRFNSRSFRNPNFVFSLPTSLAANNSILLLIDKRNQQLNIPIHFLTEQGIHNYNHRDSLLAGFITGLGIFIFILNLFLFFKMKEQLYVYYGLYVFLIFFYIVSDYGLSFMYLFPNLPQLADLSRPVASSLSTPLYLLFALHFFKAKEKMPQAYQWIKICLWFNLVVLIAGMLLMPGKGMVTNILLWAMQIVQSLNAVMVMILGVIGLQRKLKHSAYFIVTSVMMMLSFFVYANYLSGQVADNFFVRNVVNIAFCVEVALLAFVLALRFRDYKEESEVLLKRVNIQQEQIFKSLSDYEEKERLRISGTLHDSFGAALSGIRLNLESLQSLTSPENEKRSMLVNQVNDLAVEVRQLSHSLSPVLLQRNGLVKAMEHFVEGINSAGRLYIQFESIGSLQQLPFRYEILLYNVLQELLQNIIKHAEASEGIVQLALEPDLVYIFVEDNGKGLKQNEMKEGLGYLQIKELIKFVNGQMTIKANSGEGLQISIEFPLLTYDRNLPNHFSR